MSIESYTGIIKRMRGEVIVTDRELLEDLVKNSIANQSQINNIELKIDQIIKEHKAIMSKPFFTAQAHF